MSRKKILIVHPGELFPKVMAFQDRVLEMAKHLNDFHKVSIVCLYTTEDEKKESEEKLPRFCSHFYLLKKPNNSFVKKKIFGVLSAVFVKYFNIPREIIYPNWPSIQKTITEIILKNEYDIVQIETWWYGNLLGNITNTFFRVIDTHDVLYKKRELELFHRYTALTKSQRKKLAKYKQMELASISKTDLIISISPSDENTFKKHFPEKRHLCIPTGQDIERYLSYLKDTDGKTILFYGSMGGEQNIIAFWRLYNSIYPGIKKRIPDLKLIVLGSNPPREIKSLHNEKTVFVTGYVEDVRGYISKCTLMVLPLLTSGGFRSRIVEVMAMGVPVVGTSNALGGIGLTSGINCIIEDNEDMIVAHSLNLLQDKMRLDQLSRNAQLYCIQNFSIEATYGKLSRYYEKNI